MRVLADKHHSFCTSCIYSQLYDCTCQCMLHSLQPSMVDRFAFVLQLQSANAEDVNRNPVVRSLGGIFLVWLTFGFSVWYAFYFSVLAAVAGTLSILRGKKKTPSLTLYMLGSYLHAITKSWHLHPRVCCVLPHLM